MASEQFANNAASTLNGGIGSGDTTVTVNDGSVFPQQGNFRLICESELMLCTAVSGNDLTVTRGVETTTAAAHSDTTAITHIITAASVNSLITPGRKALTIPPTTGWSWSNQGSATATHNGNSIVIVGDSAGSGANAAYYYRTAPSAPYTITACLEILFFHKAYQGGGLAFGDGTKLASLDCLGIDAGLTTPWIRSGKWTSTTAYSADYANAAFHIPQVPRWFRIVDNNTNRIVSVSANGDDWLQLHSVTRTDHLTATRIGVMFTRENSATPNFAPIVIVHSWEEA